MADAALMAGKFVLVTGGTGGIGEATYFFTRAQEQATEGNDLAAVGRCSNNLGIIATMRGDYTRAVTAYTRATAAYQQIRAGHGVAESQHNLGITYREQGQLERALRAADGAVRGQTACGRESF